MIPKKPNPAGESRVQNDMLVGSSKFSDSKIGWRTQLIASRHLVSKNTAPIIMELAFGDAEQ